MKGLNLLDDLKEIESMKHINQQQHPEETS